MHKEVMVIVAFFGIAYSANPLMAKYAAVNSPCAKACADGLKNASTSIDFTKSTNFGEQFSHLNGMCRNISAARECVNKCKVSFNMFDMRAMKVICNEKTLAELKKHEPCYNGKADASNKICGKRCGGKIEETHSKLKHLMNATTAGDLVSTMKAAGDACEMSKCHARCSRDTFTQLCKESDPTASAFLQKYVEDILSAINDDFTEMGMRSVMKAMMPKQCHFLFQPGTFFEDRPKAEESEDAGEDMLAALLQAPHN